MSVNGGSVSRNAEVSPSAKTHPHGEPGSRWATKPKRKPRKKAKGK